MKQKVVFITGPTAAGKTDIALAVAKHVGGEILCADSMQIYSEMHIGTARPLAEEQQGIPHHLFGEIKPDQAYNVAQYQAEAKNILAMLAKRKVTPLVVGGTGLYLNALLYDINFTQTEPDQALREQLSKQYDMPGGAEKLYIRLKQKDPDSAQRIHPNDKKRLIRRLEILTSEESPVRYAFRAPQNQYETLVIGINKERQHLYRDIEKRVDQMINRGLEQEVQDIYQKYGSDIAAFSAIGYKEFLPYFEREVSLEATVELIKRNTRRFAKRQMTWFRREPSIRWFFAEAYESPQQETEAVLKCIQDFLSKE